MRSESGRSVGRITVLDCSTVVREMRSPTNMMTMMMDDDCPLVFYVSHFTF